MTYRVLTFDCYGTLIDWEAGILAQLRPWAQRHAIAAGDDVLLEAFARAEAACEAESPATPYSEILARVHTRIASNFDAPATAEETRSFATSVSSWPPFADTVPALRDLKHRFALVIVSNTDHASFAGTQRALGVEFDALVLAEDVGAYKPDRRMFDAALAAVARLGAAPHEVLHVAESLYHDHVPAKVMGLATCWVHRRHGRQGSGATKPADSPVRPDLYVRSLAELADLLTAG